MNVQEFKDGNIWPKTRNGVDYFDGNKFTTILADENTLQINDFNAKYEALLVDYAYSVK